MYTNIINTKKLLLIFSILLICILLINEIYCNNKEDIIIDSHMTFAESIEGT